MLVDFQDIREYREATRLAHLAGAQIYLATPRIQKPSEMGIFRALGWNAQVHFAEGLERTVDWYRENAWWWEPIRTGEYRAYYERHYGRALRG